MNDATRVELGKVAHLLSGGTPPKSDSTHWAGEVPWVSPKDMKRRFIGDVPDHISQEAARRYSTVVPENAILVVVRGMVLAKDFPVALIRRPMAINQDMKAIVASDGIDPTFLLFAILSEKRAIQREIGSSAHGTRRLATESLERLVIPLPSLTEQRSIAATLENIQTAIDVQAGSIACLRELKRATMAKVFREGLRGEPLKQTMIGTMPESWKPEQLGQVATIKSGGTPCRLEPTYWGGGVPWIKTGEIDYNVINETEETISERGLKESSARMFPSGTVVMAMYGQGATRGRVARLGIEAATNQACAAFLTGDGLDPSYLYAYLCHTYQELRNLGHGANQKNLSAEILAAHQIAVPSDPEEQHEIAEIVDCVERVIDTARRRLNLLNEMFDAVLLRLMSHADNNAQESRT